MATPYDQFPAYRAAGWECVLPLPTGKKGPPPVGYTGWDGLVPSYADCAAWSIDGGNIALRLPDGVIGIDVDDYDGRGGLRTLNRLIADYGELPSTLISSSRSNASGIRLYRVPPGTVLITTLPGIDIIQHHHRYVVVWPSVHPSGSEYVWWDADNKENLDDAESNPPVLSELPELPARWIAGLRADGEHGQKTPISEVQAKRAISAMPKGEPCEHVLKAAGAALAGGARHDSYNAAALAVLGAGRRGCPGAEAVLLRLRAAFLAEVGPDRSAHDAAAEWKRSVLGAVALVVSKQQGVGCRAQPALSELDIAELPGTPREQIIAAPPETRQEVVRLITRDRARGLYQAFMDGSKPLPTTTSLDRFLDEPDEEIAYRVADLWPTDGRVLLSAQAKAGKSTLVLNLLKPLADGGDFLGRFDVSPSPRTGLFNMELSEGQLRRWLRVVPIDAKEKIVVSSLRGAAGNLSLSTESGRRNTAKWMNSEGFEVVILDPLAPLLAALGLDENSNTDVARFFSWWSEVMTAAGVKDDLIVHHAGHSSRERKGSAERSRGASRLLDEPDAIWTLVREVDEDFEDDSFGSHPRHFRAYGRDVDLRKTRLQYNPQTRYLMADGGRVPEAPRPSEATRNRLLEQVAKKSGIGSRELISSVPGKDSLVRAALAELVAAGKIWVTYGTNRHQSHYLPHTPAPVRPSEAPGAASGAAPVRPIVLNVDKSGEAQNLPYSPTGNGPHLSAGQSTVLGQELAPCESCGQLTEGKDEVMICEICRWNDPV